LTERIPWSVQLSEHIKVGMRPSCGYQKDCRPLKAGRDLQNVSK
jgi:hypothetical protein